MTQQSVSTSKHRDLAARLARLSVLESDLVERFVKGSGPGGQKINKTSSCVYLRHRPSGIEIKCGQERSQALNRFIARRKLCERLERLILGEKTRRQREIEKIRRQKRRRSRRQKAKMLHDKRMNAQKKTLRKAPKTDEDR
ncbi:MAG: peptide chain release factor-like protein [Lentisphaerales bacterium]|jgi:protein subunit release factor B|nr:MAG: peptide chain release factor-like protein [Lentisphaerales bacterium]